MEDSIDLSLPQGEVVRYRGTGFPKNMSVTEYNSPAHENGVPRRSASSPQIVMNNPVVHVTNTGPGPIFLAGNLGDIKEIHQEWKQRETGRQIARVEELESIQESGDEIPTASDTESEEIEEQNSGVESEKEEEEEDETSLNTTEDLQERHNAQTSTAENVGVPHTVSGASPDGGRRIIPHYDGSWHTLEEYSEILKNEEKQMKLYNKRLKMVAAINRISRCIGYCIGILILSLVCYGVILFFINQLSQPLIYKGTLFCVCHVYKLIVLMV